MAELGDSHPLSVCYLLDRVILVESRNISFCANLLDLVQYHRQYVLSVIQYVPSLSIYIDPTGKPQFVDSVSYAWHGVFTQTLQGKDFECVLPMDTAIPCCYVQNLVDNVLFLCGKVDGDQIGHNRVVSIPAKTLTPGEIWEAAQRVAREYRMKDKLGKAIPVKKANTTVSEINVCSRMNYSKAKKLGLNCNVDLHQIIVDFVETWVRPECPHMLPIKAKL